MTAVPIVYAYLHKCILSRLKSNNVDPFSIISIKIIKQVIIKHIIVSKGVGKSRKGIPHCYLNEIITDMIHYNLINRLSHKSFQLVNPETVEGHDRLIKFPF